jgi:hypothetical protein
MECSLRPVTEPVLEPPARRPRLAAVGPLLALSRHLEHPRRRAADQTGRPAPSKRLRGLDRRAT